MPCVL
jgi:Glycogen debranching enzyme